MREFVCEWEREREIGRERERRKLKDVKTQKVYSSSFQVCLHFPARIFLCVFQKTAARDNGKKATHTFYGERELKFTSTSLFHSHTNRQTHALTTRDKSQNFLKFWSGIIEKEEDEEEEWKKHIFQKFLF